jgi:hypothetical protein
MEIYKRKKCVLCDHTLQSFSSFQHPNYECVDVHVKNDSWNIEYGYCIECYSVQLMSLADPKILYDKNYFQPLYKTYLWIQHNISFIKFIIDNYNCDVHKSITEIGSSSFCLGKHLIHYYPNYTVFDYTLDQAIRRNDVTYIEGNCEEYNFNTPTIVMSHVFEHLYEPKKMIQNCLRTKVKNIFISIPSMNQDGLHVGSQHTFLYHDIDIVYLFGLYQYKLKQNTVWNSVDDSFPCLFFYFELQDEVIPIDRPITPRHLFSIDYLTKYITVPKNTYLATCGMFSILLYSFIQNKENVIGVIDVNKDKQGKKFSFTELLVYPYEVLTDDVSIVVFHPKKNNIIQSIKNVANPIIMLI